MKTTTSILLFLAVAVTADQLALQQEQEQFFFKPKGWYYYRQGYQGCGYQDRRIIRTHWHHCYQECNRDAGCQGVAFGLVDGGTERHCGLLYHMNTAQHCWSNSKLPFLFKRYNWILKAKSIPKRHTRSPTRSPTRHWNADVQKDEDGNGYAIGATAWKDALPKVCKDYTDRQAIRHCIQGYVHSKKSKSLHQKIQEFTKELKNLRVKTTEKEERLKMAESSYDYHHAQAIHWKIAAKDQHLFANIKKTLAQDQLAYGEAKKKLAKAKTLHAKALAKQVKAAKQNKLHQDKITKLKAEKTALKAELDAVKVTLSKRKTAYDETLKQSKKLTKAIQEKSDAIKTLQTKLKKSQAAHAAATSQIKKVNLSKHTKNEKTAKKKLAISQEKTKSKKNSAHASHEKARLYGKKQHKLSKAKKSKYKGKVNK